MSSLLLAGCLGQDAPPAPAPADPIIHVHQAEEAGIYVNAFLVETPNGVVVVDSALITSDASTLRDELDALGKPLLAVLLTHGHPDHYNGVGALVEGWDAPVVATEAVDEIIRRDDASKEAQWKPVFGDEWPDERVFPSRIVSDDETVVYDGVSFTVHALGPGESHADSYWILDEDGDEPAAFVGDAVFNGTHSYLSDGHSQQWLDNLDALERVLPEGAPVYPGHGAVGDRTMLQEQREYITHYRDTVQALAEGAPSLDDDAKASLEEAMMEFLPTDKLSFLIALGADAIAAELAEAGE